MMSSGLIEIVKKAALDVMANSQLTDLRFGTVVDTSPLRVKVTSQFTIPKSLLIVPERLTNYSVKTKIDDETKTITIYNALSVGDKVALIRKQGGQSYYILDRI